MQDSIATDLSETSPTDAPAAHAPAAKGDSTVEGQVRRVRFYCVLQLAVASLAGVSAWLEVETIIGTCPFLVVCGLFVILLAMRRRWWMLLVLGLSSFWAVGLVALVISIFRLNPQQSVPTVPLLLTGYVLLLSMLCLVVWRSILGNLELIECRESPPRFSLRGLLLFTTMIAVLTVLGKFVNWAGESGIFAVIGLVLWGASAILAMRFQMKLRLSAERLEPHTAQSLDQPLRESPK